MRLSKFIPLRRLSRHFLFALMAAVAGATTTLAAPSPEEFGTLPAVYDAAISPDASQLGLFINHEGEYGIRVLSLDKTDTKLRMVLLSEGVKPKWITWANNERILVSVWQSESYGNTPITASYIYTMDVNDMEPELLIGPRKGFLRQFNDQVIDFLEDDPEHILMSFSDVLTTAPDIQKVNVITGKYKRLRRGTPTIQTWHTDLRGEPRVGQGLSDDTDEEKWRLTIRDVNDDKWRDSSKFVGLEPDVDIFGFTSNPNEMIVGQYAQKDTQGLYIYDLSQAKITRKLFHHDEYDVRNVILSADGKDIMGASFIADSKETQLFGDYDTVLGRMRAKFPQFNVDYVDQSKDGNRVLFAISSAFEPGALMMVHSDTDKLIRIASYRSGITTEDLGEVIPVKYSARDGFQIPAYMTLPPTIRDARSLKNLPFIVLPHGGPYARSSKRFDYFSQFFATRGYGVLQMNFRGSAGYGQTFEDAGRDNWVLMQDDVEDGARWLLEKGYADKDRLCIAGWSYGGYAALMGAVKDQDMYSCAISMAGVTDLQDLVNDAKKYRFGRITAKNSILRGFEDKDAIKENSPVRRAEEITIPLFLAHGEKDQRVHFDQYKRMKKALKESPSDTTFMEFKDEDHFLSNQRNRQKFFVGLDKFLTEHLGESEFKAP
ncbi:MAG: alpha/beta hydrolase family protein [Alphaproteobacteria bacterium]